MALLWMDGFDHYGTAATSVTNMLKGVWADQSNQVSTTRSRTGGNSLQVYVQPFGACRRILGAAKEIVGVGFAFYWNSLPFTVYNGNTVQFKNAANSIVSCVGVTTTGAVAFALGGNLSTGEVGRSADGVIVAASWQHFEVKLKAHPTEGAVEVRVNGVTVLSLSGINTGSDWTSQVDFGIRAGGGAASSGDHQFFMDDLFCWDTFGPYNNDFLGDKRVGLLFPNDDTAQSDWDVTGSPTGFGAINENPQGGDTTYVSTIDAGNVSEFEIQDITADIGVISAVQVITLQRKTVVGTCNTQVSMGSGASYGQGADRPITEQYTYYSDVFEEDPDTNAPWTKSGLNAATVSIERKS